jgi:hypothetical protein
MRRSAKNCFGRGSVYDHLFSADVKFVTLGVQWDQGLSFMMHLEKLAGVPYRRDESFEGTTRDSAGRTFSDCAVHFVRDTATAWKRNRGPLGRQLIERGIGREIEWHGVAHRLFPAAPLQGTVLSALQQDPWCMAARDA